MNKWILIGTHGKVKPKKPWLSDIGSPYSYGASMEVVEEGKEKTIRIYQSIPENLRESVTTIIAGEQSPPISQHLRSTAKMLVDKNIFSQNTAIEWHPGAILPYTDLQEVFGGDFIETVENYVDTNKEFQGLDKGTKQKITFKFLQALFSWKIKEWISIDIDWTWLKYFYLPESIIDMLELSKIETERTRIDRENKKNVKALLETTWEKAGKILIIASKEQIWHIAQELWISKPKVIKPENNQVFLIENVLDKMTRVSDD